MRFAYAITTALVASASVATLALQSPVSAESKSQSAYAAEAPRPGAPMSFADLAERLQPAVVNISTKERVQVSSGGNPFAGTPFADMFGGMGGGDSKPVTREAQSLGSGFIISADGYIVTNNHVVSGHSENGGPDGAVSSITVIMPDRKEYPAHLVGHDATSDLAVLKIDATNLPFVTFGDSTKARVGDWVIAIGNPLGLGGSVTAGIISAIHRNIGNGGPYDRYIQTDAAINQGNSGGPMFDMNGNVIGINSMIASTNGGNVGLGFAIPAELAKPIIESLKGGTVIRRGYLGVSVQPLTDDIAESLGLHKSNGELVAGVVPDSAAARAGVRQGDVIVRVNNQDVTPDQTLSFLVANLPVGAHVPIDVIRDGKVTTLTAVLAQRPTEEKLALIGKGGGDDALPDADSATSAKAAQSALGINLEALTPAIIQQLGVSSDTKGVVVVSVDPSSDAGSKGMQRGDIITSVNQRIVQTPAQVNAAIASAKAAGRPSILLSVKRGNGPSLYVAVKFQGAK